MAESFEDINKYESTWREIDALDKSINNLDSKKTERIDFTERMKKLEDIYNRIIKLDTNINNIKDFSKRKELQECLNDLKIKMLDLISDGSINNVIDWKTKDEFINKEITKVNDLFYRGMEELLKNLVVWNVRIDKILSEPLTEKSFVETITNLWYPVWQIPIEWKYCPWFTLDWKIYAFDGLQLRMCEPIFDDKYLKAIYWGDSLPKWVSITSSEKLTKASVDNPLQKKETVKASYNMWNGFSTSVSIDTEWLSATPWMSASWKWFKTKMGNVLWNTQLTASYSPWSITWAEIWWWKDKDVFKFKAWETFKFKNGISLSFYEIFKTSDFSRIKISNLSTERRASRKPKSKSNISLSAIANLDYKGNPSFVWVWGNIRL